MNIVVASGRTVHRAEKPAPKLADGAYGRPSLKAYGPTHLIKDVPDSEAKFLISRGFAREDKPAPVETPAPKADEKKADEKK